MPNRVFIHKVVLELISPHVIPDERSEIRNPDDSGSRLAPRFTGLGRDNEIETWVKTQIVGACRAVPLLTPSGWIPDRS